MQIMTESKPNSRMGSAIVLLSGLGVFIVLCVLYVAGVGPFEAERPPRINPEAGSTPSSSERKAKRGRPLKILITPQGLYANERLVDLTTAVQMARFVPKGKGPTVRISAETGVSPVFAQDLRKELVRNGVTAVEIEGAETTPPPTLNP